MVISLKIKRSDFFSTRQHSYTLWKLGSSNCCIFKMKHVTGMETCTKTYFLFIFNLVSIRIHKTSLFSPLYNLMISLWKPSIQFCSLLPKTSCPRFLFNICHSATTLDLELLSNICLFWWLDMHVAKTKWPHTKILYCARLFGQDCWTLISSHLDLTLGTSKQDMLWTSRKKSHYIPVLLG